jgi:glucose/arabinose dehydrogenase
VSGVRFLATGLLGLILMAALVACSTPQPPPTPAAARQATPTPEEDEEESEAPKPGSGPTATPRPIPTTTASGLQTELIADGLQFPQSLAFAPDGRLFFVEVKKGELRVLAGRELQARPVAKVSIAPRAEHGLIGLALDPAFDRNPYLDTFYAQSQKGDEADKPRRNRLTRWTERDGLASGETAILDDLQVGKCCHTGGKLAFAADGRLFLTFGDQGDASRQLAQSQNRINGKLLHFDVDRVTRERPDPSSLIYASGFRNPYGLDLHPVTGAPFVADNGPDMCDELNIVRQGANYGNPAAECSPRDPRFDDPIWDSGPDRLGLTGLRIYRGSMFPEYTNHALFCAVNTGKLMRAVLEGPTYDRIERVEEVISGEDGEGCRLDLATAPDGSIYYSSVTRIFRLYR